MSCKLPMIPTLKALINRGIQSEIVKSNVASVINQPLIGFEVTLQIRNLNIKPFS